MKKRFYLMLIVSLASMAAAADADAGWLGMVDKGRYDEEAAKNEKLAREVKALKAELEKLEEGHSALTGEIGALKSKNEELLSEKERLRSSSSERERLESALTEKEREIANLNDELAQAKKDAEALRIAAEKKKPGANKEPLKKKLKDAYSTLKEERQKQGLERKRLESEKDRLEAEKRSLEKELKKAIADSKRVDAITQKFELKKKRLEIKSREKKLARALKLLKKKNAALRRDLRKASKEMNYAKHAKMAAGRKEEQTRKKVDIIEKRIDKERLDMHYNLAVVFDKNGMYKDAEREYLKCLELNPEDAGVHYNLGILYDDKLNDNPKAVKHYTKFLELRPMGDDSMKVKEWMLAIQLESRIGPEMR